MAKYIVGDYKPPAGVTDTASVRNMQRMLGVTQDGLWGEQTQTAYDKYLNGMRTVLAAQTSKSRDTYSAGQAQDTGSPLQLKAKEMQGTRKYLSMSDPVFSGGDPIWGYGTYLNHMQEDERRAKAELKSAQARMDIHNAAKMYQRRADAELASANARMDIQNTEKMQQRRADAELASAQARMEIQNASKASKQAAVKWAVSPMMPLPYAPPTSQQNNHDIGFSASRDLSIMGNTAAGQVLDISKGIYMADRFGQYQTISGAGGPTVLGIMDMTKGKIRGGKPAGMWAVRVDKPHGDNGPHINMNPKYYKRADPHTPISDNTLRLAANADDALSYAKIGGKALTALSVAMDANDLYNAYIKDGGKFGNTSASTAGGIAFSWAGAFVGAKAGAIGGAAIGGVVGGLVGGALSEE